MRTLRRFFKRLSSWARTNLPITSIRNLSEQVAGQVNQQRLIARLTSYFGVLSLVLASIGLSGVTAYNAGLRVGEIGVRWRSALIAATLLP
jgi:hypothetical protein